MHTIGIVGGGLMGAGIASAFAAAKRPVQICEPHEKARATLGARIADNLRQIDATDCIALVTVVEEVRQAAAGADFVIEAAPEQLALKRRLFSELIEYARPDAILASNTSVIPIGEIAADLRSAHRIVGTHWWNPAFLVPLVEVVQSPYSSTAAIEATMRLLDSVGKKPAHVRKDVPGFIANRLQHALWREAIAMVADGICDARTLDTCVKNSFGLRMPVLGPLENADLVGLDLTLDIHRTIIPALDRHAGPHELLLSRVTAGKLGCKSAEGFRTWTAEEVAHLRAELTRELLSHRRRE